MIIYCDEPNEVADELFEWYAEKANPDGQAAAFFDTMG